MILWETVVWGVGVQTQVYTEYNVKNPQRVKVCW